MKKIITIISLVLLGTSCQKENIQPNNNPSTPIDSTTVTPPVVDTLETINITFSGQYNGKIGQITKFVYVNGQIKDSGKSNFFQVKCEIGDTVSILSNFMVPSQYNNSAWIRVSLEDVNSFTLNNWLYMTTPNGSETVSLTKNYIVI